MKIQNNNPESGRSMIEMVGVIALMGLLSAAAFVLIQSGMKAQKISRTADEVSTLVGNVRALAAEKGDFSVLPNCDDDESDIGVSLAAAILDSDNTDEAPASIGGYYSVCATEADAFYVYVHDINMLDCETMESRSFSGGTANCTGSVLKIKYEK